MNGQPQEERPPISRDEFLEFQRKIQHILLGLVELYLLYELEEASAERWLKPLRELLEKTSRFLQRLEVLMEEIEGLRGEGESV